VRESSETTRQIEETNLFAPNLTLQELIKTGTTLLSTFTKDIQNRTSIHCKGQLNFLRPKSLTESDFSSRPSSKLFTASVALNKVLLAKFSQKEVQKEQLQRLIHKKD